MIHKMLTQPLCVLYNRLHCPPEREFRKLVWPPNDNEPITITKDDLTCLEVGKLVNGNIVDFYVR